MHNFDYDSVHRTFDVLEAANPRFVPQILKARATLIAQARAMDTHLTADNIERHIKTCADGRQFSGTVEKMLGVQVMTGDGPDHFRAHMYGRAGLSPETAYVLAEPIYENLRANGMKWDPATWQVLSADAISEKFGASDGYILRLLLENPTAEPNVSESLRTNRPAVEDMRCPVMFHYVTPSIDDVSWVLMEVHPPLSFRESGDVVPAGSAHGSYMVWVNTPGMIQLRRTRAEIAQRAKLPADNAFITPGRLQQEALSRFSRGMIDSLGGVAAPPSPIPDRFRGDYLDAYAQQLGLLDWLKKDNKK